MRLLLVGLILLSYTAYGNLDKKVFPNYSSKEILKIKDEVDSNSANTKLLIYKKDKAVLGYARPIKTTTGCDSACGPLEFTLFYNPNFSFNSLRSSLGLTKINHTPFTESDYSKLELILTLAPSELRTVSGPKKLTDAFSGETLKAYQSYVVKGAAYSTLRVLKYHLSTIKILQDLSVK